MRLDFWHAAASDVSAQHQPQEGRQEPPLLQHRGESATARRQDGAADVLYLGEINDQQQAAWRKTLDVFDEDEQCYTSMSLFPDDREIPADALDSVQVKLSVWNCGGRGIRQLLAGVRAVAAARAG